MSLTMKKLTETFENFDSKLQYYQNTYDENCNHKFAKGISIVDVDYEDFVDALKFFGDFDE